LPWQDWIPTRKLRTLVRYGIVDAAVLLIFRGLISWAGLLFPSDEQHRVIEKIDFYGLILLLAVLLAIFIKEMATKGGPPMAIIYA
jgi:hypothetical protein